MKKFFLALLFVFAVCLTSIPALAAATVDFDIITVDAEADIHKFSAVINQEGEGNQFNSFRAVIEFDYSIFIPVNKVDYTVVDVATKKTSKLPIKVASYYDSDNEEYIEAVLPQNPRWDVDANSNVAVLTVEQGMLVGQEPIKALRPDDLTLLEIYFTYAENRSEKDITDSSFIVKQLRYTDKFGLPDEKYGYENETDTIVINNLVVYNASEKLAISVVKDDVIYHQSGVVTVAKETSDNYKISSEDGYVVVNTGYTAQKVYGVYNSTVTEITGLRDGILGSNVISTRVRGYTGLRFKGFVAHTIRNLSEAVDGYEVVEYGFITTAENDITGLRDDNYILNMSLVESGKAKKGIAFDSKTDIFFDINDEYTVITGVFYNIPMTKEAVQTTVAFRPYYKLSDGTCVYGETTKTSLYEVCKGLISNSDVYEQMGIESKNYINNIVALVD